MRETGRTLFQRTASAMGWWTASDRAAGELTPLYDTATTIGETAVAGGYSAGLVTAFRLPIRSPSAVAIGCADLEHGVPLAADHDFPVGACLHQFVAAAILLLVEQNRIRLTDRVDRFDEDVGNATGGTVQDLLDGGDLGYDRLARLVAYVAGETFSQFVTTHLLLAAGMARSRVDASDGVVSQPAIGYRLKSGLAYDFEQAVAVTGGGLHATAGDLLLWNRALFNGRLLTHAAVDRMTNGYGEGRTSPELGSIVERHRRGWGLESGKILGRRAFWQRGEAPGFDTWLFHFPDARIDLTLLANTEQGAATILEPMLRALLRA
ncbi:serine hydrolase domain-containing protein [Sphingomonas sp. ASY06-1R]|uniref:serine hydrolase domain-containing protein n=1 Tax=Sphingomonas sp. ASY06-1R TaxID=3445771 RepID=UPI003FA1B3F2